MHFKAPERPVLQMRPGSGPGACRLLTVPAVSAGTAQSPPPRAPALEPCKPRAHILHWCVRGVGGRAGLGPPRRGQRKAPVAASPPASLKP